jgi:hypothetical protein
MPTLDQVWQQINNLPHKYIFYTRKEIRYLPKILAPDEHIHALTSGFVDKHTWLAVCTNKRILFLDRGMFYGLRQIQMNLDRIQAIESSYTLFFGTIRLWDGASSISISMVLKSSIAPFVATVQQAMDFYKRQMVHDIVATASHAQPAAHAAVSPPSLPQHGFTDELERLAKMKAEGLLTEEEYSAAKAKLLH